MRALYILAAVLLALFLIGQIRLGGGAEYRAEGFFAWVRLGLFRIQVFPWKGSKKEKKPPKPKKEPAQKPAKEAPPPVEQPLGQRVGGALDYARRLLPIALEAAGQFKRKLQVDKLYLELTVGGDDPGDAALRYGQANAALGALWYPLTGAFRVKDGNARVRLDFDARETTIYGQAALSFKVGQMAWLGLYFGLRSLWAFLSVRKRHKSEEKQRKAA